MPKAHEFNPSNKPNTCLWCGKTLIGQYIQESRLIHTPKKGIFGPDFVAVRTEPVGEKKLYGYGWKGNGCFCSLRCGEAFGVAFAKMGKRLQPWEDEDA